MSVVVRPSVRLAAIATVPITSTIRLRTLLLGMMASGGLLATISAVGAAGQVNADPGSGWLDPSWSHRRPVTIDNRGGAAPLSQYQVRVVVAQDGLMTSDFREIRYTASDGVTLLDHYRDPRGRKGTATFWVEVPEVPARTQSTIFMYSGNRLAPDVSSGPRTFLFHDDFEGGAAYPSIFGVMQAKPWVKYEANPVLTKSPTGWDSYGLRDPMLLVDGQGYLVRDDGQYVMYYRGNEYDPDFGELNDHVRRQIGRALSPDGVHWTKDQANNPVLRLGAPGEWDDGFIGSAWAIKVGENDYRLYYDGYSGSVSGIGLATSADGVHWTKSAANPLLRARDWAGIHDSTTVVAILSAMRRSQGDYAVFAEVGPPVKAIFGALSEDGVHFTPLNEGQAILTGTDHAWDCFQAANPKVIELSAGRYIMGYNGRGGLQHQLGFAFSTDLVHWEKYEENPVVFLGGAGSWDRGRVENALVAKDDLGTDEVRMWYFGCPTNDGVRDCAIGYAVSDQDAVSDPLGLWAAYGRPEVSTEHFYSGTTAIEIDGGAGELIRRFQNHEGSYTIQFHGYWETSEGVSSEIRVIDGLVTAILLKCEGGRLKYLETTAWRDLAALLPGAWHQIELSVDTSANRVEVFVDGVSAGEYRPVSESIGGLTYLEMAAASVNAYYVDDIIVRGHARPEPAVTIGREESLDMWAGGGEHAADTSLRLDPAGSNPTSDASVLRIVLPEEGAARLTIRDVAGRHLRTLLDGTAEAGATAITWDGLDANGHPVPAGVYWAVIESGKGRQSRKLAIVR